MNRSINVCSLFGTLAMLAALPAVAADSAGMTSDPGSAKIQMAPHSVMIHSSLASALDRVKGLRAQIDAVPPGTPESMSHIRMYEQEINSDLNIAATHERELQSAARQYPSIAQSDQLKAQTSALNDVRAFSQSWQAKASNDSYWRNKKQSFSDLDSLEKSLNNAMNKTKDFSSSELNVNNVG
jgi:hypothetical protein